MKQKFHINGMHCKSCEMLIRDSLNEIPKCKVQSLSHKTGNCEVEYSKSDISEIEEKLNEIGYTI
jgi:cation transport ATPase